MRAMVVFESMFGNTKEVAAAVARGLGGHMAVDVVEVADAPQTVGADVDLLVVGGPTHAFGMSRARTRTDAAGKTHRPLVSTGTGLREWLDLLRPRAGTAAAAFDTRVYRPRLPGTAAAGAARRLRRLGLDVVCPHEDFYVHDMTGPLLDGELGRAEQWGAELAAAVTGGTGRRSGGRSGRHGAEGTAV